MHIVCVCGGVLLAMQEEHRACLAQLKTAKEAVHATKAAWQEEQKKAEAARQSAMQAYQDAQKHLSDYDKTRNNKVRYARRYQHCIRTLRLYLCLSLSSQLRCLRSKGRFRRGAAASCVHVCVYVHVCVCDFAS